MTTPDALASDLRDHFLSSPPLALPAASLRLRCETEDIPSPRLVFLPGDPAKVLGMIATSRLPISLDYVTSMDTVTPADHATNAALLDTWLRSIRATLRRSVIASRVYLHDLYSTHPVTRIDAEAREQISTLRAEAIVTLAIVEEQ